MAEGTLLVIVAVLTIAFAYHEPLGRWFFSLIFIAVATLASWEYGTLLQRKNIRTFLPLLLIGGSGYLLLSTASLFHLISDALPLLWLLLSLGALSIPILREKQENIFSSVAFTLFGFVYCFLPAKLLLDMTYSAPPSGGLPTRWWLIWTLLIVKGSDSAAYFGGKLFGKRPLTSISPNKTQEGFVIGCLFGGLCSLLMGLAFDAPRVSSLTYFILGVLLSIVASVGDLIESRFKREIGVKDSNSLPGLGGFLDMADSLLLAIPFAYFCFFLLG